MSALSVSFKMFLKQVKDDKVSVVMTGFPVMVALFLYFFIPGISENLTHRYGMGWNLQPYYPLFDIIVIAFAFCTPGFAASMVMLSELDDKVVPSLCASPLRRGGYLFSRLGLPTILSIVLATILCFTLNLSGLPIQTNFLVLLTSLVACTLPSMIVIAFARNKVEGVALFKMSIFTTFAVLVPFFVSSWVQWLFGFLPSFWIAKMVTAGNYWLAFPALLTSMMWLLPLWVKFKSKI